MPSIPGKGSYMGLAVALNGESEIRPSSAVDGLTITQTTGTITADYFVLRKNVRAGCTAADTNSVFRVDSTGGMHYLMPVYNISTASTAGTVDSTMVGGLITMGGCSSGQGITLPTPVAGAAYTFYGTDVGASAATRFTCGTSGAFIVDSDSGGADGFLYGTSATMLCGGLTIVGLSATKYAVLPFSHASSMAGTSGLYICDASS